MITDIVVLLGPPGSGKTTIGKLLGSRWLWRDREAQLMRRWGSRDNLIRNSDIALRELADEILSQSLGPDRPVVVESTGLSEAPLLDELDASRKVVFVRLDVSEATAMARIETRDQGDHLTDDRELNRSIWSAFYELVAAHRRADLVIDTELTLPEEAVSIIVEVVP